jgi:hypothetical protein
MYHISLLIILSCTEFRCVNAKGDDAGVLRNLQSTTGLFALENG